MQKKDYGRRYAPEQHALNRQLPSKEKSDAQPDRTYSGFTFISWLYACIIIKFL